MTNRICGDLTVINRADDYVSPSGKRRAMWNCRCKCGKEAIISGNELRNGKRKDCGCKSEERRLESFNKTKDKQMVGKTFGRLTVIKRVGSKIYSENTSKQSLWLCQCECGNLTEAVGTLLKRGITKSCGCLQKESIRKIATKHGHGRERLYGVWASIKNRCYCKTEPSYHYYGGKGITMCDEWKNDYMAFRRWAYANGYDKNAEYMQCTIDRIDVNGNYCPENCRWVNQKIQCNNKSNNKKIKYMDKYYTIAELAEMFFINKSTMYGYFRKGKTLDDILKKKGEKINGAITTSSSTKEY